MHCFLAARRRTALEGCVPVRAPSHQPACAAGSLCDPLPVSNAGLTTALELLKDIADQHEGVSYADLFQLASATAIEV